MGIYFQNQGYLNSSVGFAALFRLFGEFVPNCVIPLTFYALPCLRSEDTVRVYGSASGL